MINISYEALRRQFFVIVFLNVLFYSGKFRSHPEEEKIMLKSKEGQEVVCQYWIYLIQKFEKYRESLKIPLDFFCSTIEFGGDPVFRTPDCMGGIIFSGYEWAKHLRVFSQKMPTYDSKVFNANFFKLEDEEKIKESIHKYLDAFKDLGIRCELPSEPMLDWLQQKEKKC